MLKAEWFEPQRDHSVQNNPLIIDEKHYPRGIGVHADSEIEVTVPEGFTHFVADVGVDDEVPEDSPASVIFTVLGDGVVLYESPILRANSPPQRISVNVEGVITLTMKVSMNGDGSNSDHADWGSARFTVRK